MLTITVTQNVSTTVLSLKGDLDFWSADDLAREVIYLLEEGNQQIVIDLTRVKNVDLDGAMTLRGLVETTAQNYGSAIKLIVQPGSVACQQLESYRVVDWADCYPEVKHALESFFS